MIKKFTLTSLGIILVVGALVGVKMMQFSAMGAAGANMVMPPDVVTAAPVTDTTWESNLSATGSLVAVQGVTVGAEAPGKVVKLAFESGATVKAGDLLVQLDVSTEEAQLRAAEATAAWGAANLARARELRQTNTNSPADLDAADAQAKQAAAQADSLRAIIAKKTIRAPFAGRLGLRLVNLGQILKEGDAIASLQTLDPIYVNFSVPQQQLAVMTPGAAVRVVSDAAPGETFEGQINAVNPDVDPTTRNVRVQATLVNAAEKLRPGMFAQITVVLPTREKVLAIPATAVLYAPFGDSVFVIEDQKNEKTGEAEKVLRQQFVQLGATRGDFVTVVTGLKAGETVVSSGVFKLRAKETVVIDNQLAPNAQLAPKPKNT